MPLYFFHVRSSGGLIPDDLGIELSGLDEVRTEARDGAKGLLKEAIDKDEPVDDQIFEVTNEDGHVVLRYPFRDAIKLNT